MHHILELEKLFDFIKAQLKDGGFFAVADMIGRNGHQRWPETALILKMLWPMLTGKQRYHFLLSRLDDVFTDHDCSTDGFEGIRSQDILHLILKRFNAAKFIVGGFIDVLVDRGYGHGYDPNSESDLVLSRFLSELNEILLDAGAIKPTMMFAHFVKEKAAERFYRSRSARASIRMGDPGWISYHRDR